jgi:hypothetical protein
MGDVADGGAEESVRGNRVHLAPDTMALLVVAAAVLVANLPSLLGFFHPNPFNFRGGLTQSITNGLLGGRPTIDPSNGFQSQALGHLAALDILHLHLPWWNPYEGTGMPLLGETLSAAWFPPTLLTAFANGQLYEHMLLELIAGICTYRLLRRIELTRPAAIAGAVAFALNGKFAWFADEGVNPLPFLPMLLLGIERALDATRAGRRGGWGLIALAGALTAYAGFPEVAYIDLLLAVVWLGWRCGCLERRSLGRFAGKIGLGAVAALMLAAPMLVAMIDYLGHADLVTHTGSQVGSRHLPLSDFPQLLMPYIFGPLNGAPRAQLWVMVGGYLSTVLLLFAVLGLITRGRRGLKLVLGIWGLLVFARMYGQPPLLGHILGILPDMSKVQFYRYATAAFELPVIVLAALGLDDLTRVPQHRRRLAWGALGAMAAVGGAALVARPVVDALPIEHRDAFFKASIAWGLGTAAAVGVIAFVRVARARAVLLVLVVVVDAIVLFAVPEFSAPRATKVDLAPVNFLRQHLGEARFYTLLPIQPNYGSYFELASLGVDDFPPKRYARFVHRRLDPWAPFVGFRSLRGPSQEQELVRHLDGYRLAGVRYVLTPAAQPLPTRRHAFRLVLLTPTTRIYQLTRAAPYFAVAGCQVRTDNRYSVSLSCARPTTLIRRETWFAGWSAEIDGHPTSIRRVHGIFQAVTVPAGSHRITFSFEPVDMNWALLALLAGCVLLITSWAPRLVTRARALRPATARTS